MDWINYIVMLLPLYILYNPLEPIIVLFTYTFYIITDMPGVNSLDTVGITRVSRYLTIYSANYLYPLQNCLLNNLNTHT